jgi:hypothetical protein
MIKRPTIDVIYSAVSRSADAIAHSMNELLFLQYSDTYMRNYFGELCFDQANGSYEPVNESLDLKGSEDLEERIRRLGSGRWTLDVNLGFAPVVLDIGVFADPPGSAEISTIVTTDPATTAFLEEFKEAHPLYAVFLVRVATAVGADMFIGALERDTWRCLTLKEFTDRQSWPLGTYVMGWRSGLTHLRELLEKWNLPASQVARTTLGYHFITLIPEP